jgi:hypothetical protein
VKGLFCAVCSDRASHFLETPKAGGAGGSTAADAGRTGAGGAGDRADPGLLAASARTKRAEFRHLARAPAAGVAGGWDQDGGGGDSLSRPVVSEKCVDD